MLTRHEEEKEKLTAQKKLHSWYLDGVCWLDFPRHALHSSCPLLYAYISSYIDDTSPLTRKDSFHNPIFTIDKRCTRDSNKFYKPTGKYISPDKTESLMWGRKVATLMKHKNAH